MSGSPHAHSKSALLAELILRTNKNGESVDALLPAFFTAALAELPKEDQFRRELAQGFLDWLRRQQAFETEDWKYLDTTFLIPEHKIKYTFFALTGHLIHGNSRDDPILQGYFEAHHPGCWKVTHKELAAILEADLSSSNLIKTPEPILHVLSVNVQQSTVTLDNQPFDVSSDQAIRWLKVLSDHPGEWLSGAELRRFDPELDGVRTDRLRPYIPTPVLALIQSERGKGSRLRLA